MRFLESLNTDRPRFGQSRRAGEDPVRFGQAPELSFAPSSIASFRRGGEGQPAHLAVLCFGLFGPNGPLPIHLTEYARDRLRNKDDATFARFIDLFHHRMISLFYRAWANAQPTTNFDRPEADRFSVYVGSLFGMAMDSVRGRGAVSDLAKLHYAGPLSCQSRHAGGLEGMIADFFDVPVTVEEFVGQWVDLPEECHLRLGGSPATGSLGLNATVGARIWDCQQKFRIHLGPLDLEDYERLLPRTRSERRLAALVRSYVGEELIWDVNLILKREAVPPLPLGGPGRLGWTTWLTGPPRETDADELTLAPSAGS
jgi:type VI secretion system protein ImpH